MTARKCHSRCYSRCSSSSWFFCRHGTAAPYRGFSAIGGERRQFSHSGPHPNSFHFRGATSQHTSSQSPQVSHRSPPPHTRSADRKVVPHFRAFVRPYRRRELLGLKTSFTHSLSLSLSLCMCDRLMLSTHCNQQHLSSLSNPPWENLHTQNIPNPRKLSTFSRRRLAAGALALRSVRALRV
jgi:hypothetical protein